MSAKFTAGPWLVHSTNRLVVQADGAFAPVTVKNGKVTGDTLPNSICLLRDPTDGFTEDETLANGFLIAAAPELFKAAVRVRARAQTMRLDLDACEAMDDLDAAIRKARGEQ